MPNKFSVPAFFQRNAFTVRLDIIRGKSNMFLVIDNIRLSRKKVYIQFTLHALPCLSVLAFLQTA